MKRGRKIEGIDMTLTDSDTTAFFNTLKEKGSVTVGGIGTFSVVTIKPRTLYHNTAKRTITTEPYNKLKYTPTKMLKTYINK